MKYLLCLLASLSFYTISHAQPGTLDLSFGDQGKVLDTSMFFTSTVTSITVQKDGKILIGGGGKYKGFGTFRITRFLPDGTVDETFGEGGNAFALFPNFKDTATDYGGIAALAILPDGKILAAGNTTIYNDSQNAYYPNIAFARFSSEGKPDSSFGDNGALTAIASFVVINDMALQADGKILLAGGSVLRFGGLQLFVDRFLPDGTIDAGFADSGQYLTQKAIEATSVVVQDDGKIVAAGSSGIQNTTTKGFLIRLNANGQPDETFGSGGGYVKDAAAVVINDIALQPDGKIAATGYSNTIFDNLWTVFRYNTNGSPDVSFGNGGKTVTYFPLSFGQGQKLFLTNDKIVTAGSTYDGVTPDGDFALAAYNMDGSPDTAFGNEGIQTTDLGADDFISTAALQPDGKILLFGQTVTEQDDYTGALLRYNGYPVRINLLVRVKRYLHNHGITWQGLGANRDVAYYTVERSASGVTNFTMLGIVSATAFRKDYSYTNSNLLEGNNYYRIKAVTKGGAVACSEVVSAVNNAASALSIYPNPAKDYVVVGGLLNSNKTTLSISNSNGTPYLQSSTVGTQQYKLNTAALKPGTYYLHVNNGSTTTTATFVKE